MKLQEKCKPHWLYEMIMKCLVKGVRQYHIFSKKLPNQNTVVFKYCFVIGFVYEYQAIQSLAGTGVIFQNNLYIFKVLIILFIKMFDMQYWKWNNIHLNLITIQWVIYNACNDICNDYNIDLVADLNFMIYFKCFCCWLLTNICMLRSSTRRNSRPTFTDTQWSISFYNKLQPRQLCWW